MSLPATSAGLLNAKRRAMTKADWCRIRYPDPVIKVNDTVKVDISTGKITDIIKVLSDSFVE